MSDDHSNRPALLKPAEAAELLRVEVATLATWRSREPNRVPFIKIGGRSVRYRLSDLLTIIEGCAASNAPPDPPTER